MKHNPRFLICGNYGATNLGDEAILQSILQCVTSVFPGAHVQIVSADPAKTKQQYLKETVHMIPAGFRSFVRSIFSRRLRETLRAYKHADAVIFGGGGLFTDEKPPAIFIWVMQILPAFLYKKPVMCFGQSVGPLIMRSSRWAVQKIFKRIKIITVRDEASKKLLNKLGIENIHVLPDPVFGLHTNKFLPGHNPNPHSGERKPYIVFSLRPWIKHAEKNRKILAQFVDWVSVTYHLKTYFVPFQSHRDDDEAEVLQVFSQLEYRHSAEVLSYSENIGDVMKLMEESTAVIGMRLHSLIFSTLTHTPFLALSYSLKVSEVVSQLEMENYLCEYRFIDLEQLKKKFEALFSHRAHLEKALAEKQKLLASKTEDYKKLLQELVS